MKHVVFACAALIVLASPASAQQTAPNEPPPAQTMPEQSVPPAPPPPRAVPPFPPSFVPPPRARVYDHRTKAHRSTHRKPVMSHRRTVHRKRTTSQHATAHARKTALRHAKHERRETVHASKRTIRLCHRMSYKQITRNSSCRALMRRDLQAAEHRQDHASHRKASAHRKSSTHRKSSSQRTRAEHRHARGHHRD